jgi:6-pyruvoyltetrahydropterin/6-carboxytetrahydropterin synthase
MHEISKDFTFAAAHRLAGLPDGHKCARIHGHHYRVRAVLTCPRLAGPGWITDYADLGPLKTLI